MGSAPTGGGSGRAPPRCPRVRGRGHTPSGVAAAASGRGPPRRRRPSQRQRRGGHADVAAWRGRGGRRSVSPPPPPPPLPPSWDGPLLPPSWAAPFWCHRSGMAAAARGGVGLHGGGHRWGVEREGGAGSAGRGASAGGGRQRPRRQPHAWCRGCTVHCMYTVWPRRGGQSRERVGVRQGGRSPPVPSHPPPPHAPRARPTGACYGGPSAPVMAGRTI